MEVSQYVLEALRRDEEFVLYRGEHSDLPGSPSVLLLAPASVRPALVSIKKIEHEYSLRGELDSSWAVRPLALSDQSGQMTLVLEDPGGETLDRLLPGPMELTRFLRFAVGIATALSGLHEKGLIHKDVKPANILVDLATGHARLTGFGIASRLSRERQSLGPPEFIAGTLPYVAPEQTGRMNRSLDSRSDLYALGVTLYEMVTGTLPFMASDPMELVHCHIARQPTPPCERLQGLSRAVSAIIMKLLAKTAEDRYQTAAGAGSDLKRCLHEWETQNRIDDFPLGEHDTPDRLLIQEKLYGRESEIDTLLAAFDRVVAGAKPELVLVSGYSGIGKTTLVNELHKWLVPSRGLFASGKFNEYKRDIPYATLAQAFQQLIQALLGKSESELSDWRDALREAMDPNGQLIVDLVPNLELIIGEQPPAPELSPQDAQRRFQFVFRRFIGVFARPEHPLALFLDDLQWLDASTLDLLENVLTRSDLQHLILLGAYRDNEVTPAHPLMRRIEAIRNAGASVNEVSLPPLAREHVDQLIADALHCEPTRAAPLGHLVYEKTAGNPFFVIQFLFALADEGLIAFDHRACRWSWDVARIRAKGYTANVADLIVGKLTRLQAGTQEALQQLACLGNSADLTTLALLRGTSEEQLHADLWEAARLELIERLDGTYRFVHDRVREAAYSLIPEPSRADAHLRIGRLLVAHTPRDEREEIIFEIVNQLNRGVALISSPDEREELAGLNLMAGKRAKNATAYASALTYLTAGRTLLPEDCWGRCAALTFAFEVHRAECEFLTGAFAAAEERLSELSSRELPLVDLATVTMLKGELFTTLGRSDRAVEACLDYLRHTGVRWSPHPTKEEVQQEYERLLRQIGNRRIEEFVELPLMTSPEGRATMDVLTAALAPAAHNYDDLIFLVVCRMANRSLEDGNSDGSCFAYVWLGTLIGIRFGNYRVGFSFGKLGLDLVEHRGLRRFEARVYLLFAIISHWTQPVRTGLGLVRRAREAANRLGDIAFAGYSYPALIPCLLATGEPLADVHREAEAGLDFARRFRFGVVIDLISVHLRLIQTLRGLTPEFGSFDDTEFDEGRFEQQLAEDPRLSLIAFLYWLRKLQARFFAGAYASAVAAAANAHRLWRKTPAVLEQADYEFYAALARAAHCDAASTAERTQHHEALAAHHRQLQEWAGNCPENFEDRAALVGAELARIEGGDAEAMRLYERAIRSARANGFLHNEALACELAARFYSARGFEEIARLYLGNARQGYLRWGADGKVLQLDQQYPQLRQGMPVFGSTSIIAAPVEHLDLATVIKVSQVVSGEMVIEKLIDRLMRAAIEHAGAERGLLIVPQGDELHTQAVATTSGEDVSVELPGGTHTGAALPESLVRYVMRTRETVLLDDAASQNPFSGDPYIVQRRARSILCLPLINQTRIIGILYLENNLTPHVFTAGRVTVLKVLASQAAISLENARLYCDVENREVQLRLITDSTPAMICSCLPDGSADFFNRRWLEYLNLPLEEISGWRWTSVIHPEDLEDVVNKWRSSLATGEPLEVEARSRRGDGEYRRLLHRTVPLRNEHGKVVRWYVSSIDVEDRRRSEEAVRRSEAYLAEAQKLSHTGSFGWNVFTDVHFWSGETFRIFEFDPSATVSLPLVLERVHPEDLPSVDLAIAAAHRAEGINLELRLLMPDGRIKYLHVVGKAERGETGAIEIIGAVMDVTARKLTEIELRRSKAHLADAQQLSRTGSVGMEVSTKRIFWSDEAARIYGYPPGTEPTPDLILRRSHPDDVGRLVDVLGRAAQGGFKFDWEHRLLMPDGSIKHLHDLAHSVRDEAGNEEIVGAILDITERKVAEEAIRRSEAYLTEAQELTHTGSWGWKPDGGEIVWSDETYRIFGYDRAEKPTLEMVFERIHSHDRALAQQVIDGVSPSTDFEHEYRLVMPGGGLKHVHVRGRSLLDSSGKIEVVGAVTDFTERKTAEDKIRCLVEAGILGIFIATGEDQIVEANRALLQMLQYDHHDLASGRLRWRDLIPAELRERDQRALTEARASGVFQPYETEFRRKDGSRLAVLVGGALVQSANEGIVFVLDLSEQKRTEEALRSSEGYLAEAQKMSQTGSWAWSPATSGPSYWSDECYRVLGFDPTEGLPQGEDFFQRIHPDDRPGFRELAETSIREKAEFEADYRVVHSDSRVRDIHVIAHPVLSTSGELVEFVGTVIDVTERKRAEEELRRSETGLRQVLDLTPQLIAVYGPNRERLYANRVMLDYLGLSLNEWRERSRFGAALHPDDWERATSQFDRSVSSGAGFEVELRLCGRDRNYRWFLARCNPMCDDKEQIMRWYLALTDIDERKRAEQKLQRENVALREEIDRASMFEEIVGTSMPLKAVQSRIAKVAPTDSTVLITGETGTGKELIARAVHKRSRRSGSPFVSVNCAALAPTLISSELFGHEKGAFTGALQRRLGRFEMAEGGTIFLDEVGDLLPDTQAALLRVLQEREFERVGGGQPIHTDVRVIAATNRDLIEAVENGTFRQDLFYRLNVFPIEVPPLRHRKEDVLMLVEYFVQRYASRAGKNIRSMDKKTLDLLQSYDWPGNIRELQNVIERSVILSAGDVFSVDELWLSKGTTSRPVSRAVGLPASSVEARSEREIIEAALAESRGRVSGASGAAAKLRIPSTTLATRIKALKINKLQFKFPAG